MACKKVRRQKERAGQKRSKAKKKKKDKENKKPSALDSSLLWATLASFLKRVQILPLLAIATGSKEVLNLKAFENKQEGKIPGVIEYIFYAQTTNKMI